VVYDDQKGTRLYHVEPSAVSVVNTQLGVVQ
jgi:hypothetical protein